MIGISGKCGSVVSSNCFLKIKDHPGERFPAKIDPLLIFKITKFKKLGGISHLILFWLLRKVTKTHPILSRLPMLQILCMYNVHVQLDFPYEDKYNWAESMKIKTIRI